MKYKYKLSELDCANCANEIECKLKEDKNIKNASVNFSKLTVSVETNIDKNVKKYVENIVRKVEPETRVLELQENLETKKNAKKEIIRLSIGILISVIGIIIKNQLISNILIILGYIILLYRTTKTAINLLLKSHTINENLLLTVSCIGAYLTNNIHEGIMVITLYEIGKIIESIAINNTRKSISNLMDIKPEYANLKENNGTTKKLPEEVKVGSIIIIKQGEKIPIDGIVVKGTSKLNTSALTGESKLRKVSVSDKVLSGSINTQNILEIKTTSTYKNSTASRILELVETATDRKAKTETFVSKAAKIYTPIILVLALLTAILLPIIANISPSVAIYRALVFLVVSCPCAIAISVPLSYFSGIGASSKEGILIKGSDYLDSLSKINLIIFDKTGTITTGNFTDYKLEILDKNYTKEEVMKFFVMGESLSNHPIAQSILNIFRMSPKLKKINNFQEISGKGISYTVEKKQIKIGTPKFCNFIDNDSAIYLSINNKKTARLELLDGLKPNTKELINEFKKINIKTKMYTGDSKEIAESIAKQIKIDEVKYELLPEDKYNHLEKELQENTTGKTAFVGDGINDAPSLALADIGISMGGIGSASAIEASDVVVMTDELGKIIKGIKISKYTNKIIKQNLIFALSVKILVLILSTIGYASMYQAVFADTGVTLLTILNTTRITKNH